MAHTIIVERRGGIDIRIVGKDIIHGYLHDCEGPATLLVYDIVFNSRTNTKRIEFLHVDCFYTGFGGSKAPEVLKVAPWAVCPVSVTQAEAITRSGEAKAGSGQPEVTLNWSFNVAMGVNQTTKQAATIISSVRPDLENTASSWTLTVN